MIHIDWKTGKTPSDVTRGLKPILERNYAALGFQLCDLRNVDDCVDIYMQGMILCPCGGCEHFSFLLNEHLLGMQKKDLIEHLATMILRETASLLHLRKDVEDGLLPAFDIEKHAFSGVLL